APRAAGCLRHSQGCGPPGSLPFERSLLPHVNEADQQHADEDAHLDQAEHAEFAEHGRPRHDEDDFQVEDDELDGDEVVADVELHPRIFERGEAAFVGRELLGVVELRAQGIAYDDQGNADSGCDKQKQQGRQVFGQHGVPSATGRMRAPLLAGARRDRDRPRLALVWCPRGDSNPHDLSRYHLKVVRLPIPPPGQIFTLSPYACTKARYCNRYQPPCGTSCPVSPCAGGGAAGGWASGAAGTAEPGAAGAVPGAAGTSPGAAGAEGISDITPRSTAEGPAWVAILVACQAMKRVSAKNTMASHLVDLLRKLEAPRAPKTVADAPPPKPDPACAPAPRCMRISAISER